MQAPGSTTSPQHPTAALSEKSPHPIWVGSGLSRRSSGHAERLAVF